MSAPRMLTRRRYFGKYRQFRCALCYRRFWPWQERLRGANYFRHPYMMVHHWCGVAAATGGESDIVGAVW